MMSGIPARLAALMFAVLLFSLGFASAAHAHASLLSTVPGDGTMVATAPSTFSLTFNEPVSPLLVKLIEPDGSSVALDRVELKGDTLEIAAPDGLGQGTHVLSWRAISEDGHPVGGSVVFSIGTVSAAPPAELQGDFDWTVRAGLWLGKLGLYAGLFLGVGGAFAICWLLPAALHGRRAILAALAIGIAGTIVAGGFQGLDALALPAARFADALVWSTSLHTSFALTLAASVLAFAVAIASLFVTRLSRLASIAGLLLAGAGLAASGHASAAHPQWLMRPAVFLHAAAVAFWIGALVPLGIALFRRDPEAAPALRRFSAAIPWIVAMLVVAGAVLAIVQVQTFGALLDTAYGNVLLVKLALLGALFVLAAINRWRWTGPALGGEAAATKRLARTIAVETLVALAIFGVVACWRFTPPPRALALAAAEPAATHMHAEKAMADVTVTPGRAGPVDVSIFVTSGEFDPIAAKEVTLVLSNPAAGIEPIRRPAVGAGEGAWKVEGLLLPIAGVWQIRLDVLISDFEMAELKGQISIRP